jgi:methionyl-tRNA formyltransferase
VLFAMRCRFSEVTLHTLFDSRAQVVGIIVPGPPELATPIQLERRRALPMATRPSARSVDDLAARHNVPLYQCGQLTAVDAVTLFDELRPDVLAVACYPTLIPAHVRRLARLGAFNVHPSLLPDKRGPDPMFWTFRDGDQRAGVTVHALTGRFDGGAIAAQEAWTFPDGVTEDILETNAAERGVELLVNVVRAAEAGTLSLTIQDEALATWAPHAHLADFRLDVAMRARAAFNFVRGLQARGEPFTIDLAGDTYRVVGALDYATSTHPPSPAVTDGDVCEIAFVDGVVYAKLAPLAAAHP